MLRCSQCQFVNSEDAQSCQRCGTSLTQHNCPECGKIIDLAVLNCPYCHHSMPSVHLLEWELALAEAGVTPDWSKDTLQLEPNLTELDQGGPLSGPNLGTDLTDTLKALHKSENLSDVPTMILPSQLMHLESGGQTDVGRCRNHNEDYFVIDQQLTQCVDPSGPQLQAQGIYILCDGMGGHAGGEVASSLGVETLLHELKENWSDDELPDEAHLKKAIGAANQAIYTTNENKGGSGSARMGTTLVMALVKDAQICIAHVGDSRLYRVTQQYGLEQLTVDHDVGQRNIQRGVKPDVAYSDPDAYQLTQALGPKHERCICPDIQTLAVTEDALFLLCSDGLTDNDLLETYTSKYVTPLLNPETDINHGVKQLIHLANQYNGHDNVTVIAIRMRLQQASEPSNPQQ